MGVPIRGDLWLIMTGGWNQGSGKTGAFAIPVIQALLEKPQRLFAVVLAPTRCVPEGIDDTTMIPQSLLLYTNLTLS
jgi:ATP-dependent helicase YprA (DUF1998 family)